MKRRKASARNLTTGKSPKASGQLWGGRFDGAASPLFAALNRSIAFDHCLYREDIEGSLAHAAMLRRVALLTPREAARIRRGLLAIRRDLESGALPVDFGAEDIHSFMEAELTRRIGPVGGKLHTGRSRNDQVATDTRLYLRRRIDNLRAAIGKLIAAMVTVATPHVATLMPAYTHLQRAQPVTFAHHLLAYVEMLGRDAARLADCRARVNQSPLGAGACAGTGLPIHREHTARALGFDGVMANSMDAVATRDYLIEFLAAAANAGVTLSRLAEDVILWSTHEFGFVTLADAVTSGSSLMPQKKNPDGAELLRGKAGRLIGNLNTVLAAAKGLPLTYNKDLQEDKEALLDSINTWELCLGLATELWRGITVNIERMRAAATGAGYMNATEVADYLVRKGMPFRAAHHLVGRIVRHAEQHDIHTLGEIKLAAWRKFSPLIGNDIYICLAPEAALHARNHTGGPAPAQVRRQLAKWRKQARTLR